MISVMMYDKIVMNAPNINIGNATGQSFDIRLLNISRPIPGMLKITSMISEPDIKAGIAPPIMVITGNNALPMTCFRRIVLSEIP